MKILLKVNLKNYERYELNEKLFIVREGKANLKYSLSSMKEMTSEMLYQRGDIVANFFCFVDELDLPEVYIEVEALTDIVLEEIPISKKDILQNLYMRKIVLQLIKGSIVRFFYQVYDTKTYMLLLMMFYADEKNKISKKDISYENFNISRSAFYLHYSELKDQGYIRERNGIIKLNIKKINELLMIDKKS